MVTRARRPFRSLIDGKPGEPVGLTNEETEVRAQSLFPEAFLKESASPDASPPEPAPITPPAPVQPVQPPAISSGDPIQDDERKKYEAVWTYEFYREQADGEPWVDHAFEKMGCKPGETLIDWGCGKGTPAQLFKEKGLDVTGLDIAHNCLDEGVDIKLVTGCLWSPPSELAPSDYAFCTDVLEHLPPNKVDLALQHICERTRKAAFIQVCIAPDTAGRKMDPPMKLHLSVFPPHVWTDKLKQLWRGVRMSQGRKSRVFYVCTK